MSRRKTEKTAPDRGGAIDLKTGERAEQPALPVVCARIRFFRRKKGMDTEEPATEEDELDRLLREMEK